MKSFRAKPMKLEKGLINGLPYSYGKNAVNDAQKDEVRGLIFMGLFGIGLILFSFLVISGFVHIGV